jgi:hypothetical protein
VGSRAVTLAIALALAGAACSHAGGATSFGDDAGDDASFDYDGGAHDVSIPSSDAIVLVDSAGDDSATQPDVVIPGSCAGQPDGTVCVLSHDPCYANAVCTGGLCGGLVPKPNGTVCKASTMPCEADAVCTGGQCGNFTTRGDGYNWQAGDDTARCCVGQPLHTTSDADCGACGIRCNAGNGESCSQFGGHYFCRGCVASAACWSHCCSTSYSPYSCAASDCAGHCDAQYCPPGTHCVVGSGTSDYCAY